MPEKEYDRHKCTPRYNHQILVRSVVWLRKEKESPHSYKLSTNDFIFYDKDKVELRGDNTLFTLIAHPNLATTADTISIPLEGTDTAPRDIDED